MQSSIVNRSELNPESRLDAEYYKPKNLAIESLVRSKAHQLLGRLCQLVSGPFGSTVTTDRYVTDSNFRYIRGQDINDFFVDDSDPVNLGKELFDKLPQFHLKPFDLLVTVVGMNFGKAAIVFSDSCPAIFSCKSSLLRGAKINPFYLTAFLSSKYGFDLVRRGRRGAAQPGINLYDLYNVPVPSVSDGFQESLQNLILQARGVLLESKSLYNQTEQHLLSELGLQDWEPSHTLAYVRNYSEAARARRVDAEHFQPAYAEVEEYLCKNFEVRPIGQLEFINVTTGQYCEKYVDSTQGQPYIRGTDIANGTIQLDDLVFIDPGNQLLEKRAKEGDVVVTRVGTIGLSARIPEECEGGTISDNLIRLRFSEERLNSYYLALYLGSKIGVSLMTKNSRGSVQQRLNQETLKEIVIPILPRGKQDKIATLVQQSHSARRKGKAILEKAKLAVEIAIEKSEEQASLYLKTQ